MSQLAASSVAQATGQPEPKPEKNPAAVALGAELTRNDPGLLASSGPLLERRAWS